MTESSFPIQDLVSLLSPTLGEERSREIVRGALETMGLSETTLTNDDAVRVLDLLGQSAGIVGSVARFAKVRLELSSEPSEGPTSSGSGPGSGQSGRGSHGFTTSAAELAALLAPNVGQEKSEEIVRETLRRKSLPPDQLLLHQGLEVLEHVAAAKGVLGVAARFAKARLIMLSAKR
jgi:hypothetical protein